jgi:hypothetical protein
MTILGYDPFYDGTNVGSAKLELAELSNSFRQQQVPEKELDKVSAKDEFFLLYIVYVFVSVEALVRRKA